MAILEIGINIGRKPLLEIKYYLSSDIKLDPKIKAHFLTGVGDFIDETFGDKINVISLSDFKLICYNKKIQPANKEEENVQNLQSFAIIEQGTDSSFVKKHLKKIIKKFVSQYSISEILSEEPLYFKEFEQQINEILGDLKVKIDDRLKTIFRA